jgi:hypothetical protein
MNQNITRIILTTAIAALIGAGVGYIFDKPELGLVFGLTAGPFIGIFWNTSRRRWLAVAGLNVALVVSYLFGGPISFLLTAGAAFLGFAVAAFIIRDLFGMDEMQALGHHINLAFGRNQGFQVIEDGKVVVPNGVGQLLGPRTLIVRPGSAAVTVRGQTRAAYGAGVRTTQRYEYVKLTYNLDEQQKRYTFDNVLTNDLMSAQVRLCVTYALRVSDDARLGRAALSDEEQRRLCDLPFRMPDWHDGVRSAVEQAVRLALREPRLEPLLTTESLEDLQRGIQFTADLSVSRWGGCIDSVVIEEIATSSEVNAAMNNRWLERARAEGFQTAIGIIAQTYEKATGASKMSDEQVRREIARHALEELAKDPSGKLILTPELNELLNGLAG